MRLHDKVNKMVGELNLPDFKGISIDTRMYYEDGDTSMEFYAWTSKMGLLANTQIFDVDYLNYTQIAERAVEELKANYEKRYETTESTA